MAGADTSGHESLHIGDTVLFMIKTKERNGYVYSELSSSSYSFLTIKPTEEAIEKPHFSNVTYATFKVLAPNKYKATQYLRELEQKGSAEYEILNAKRALELENSENDNEQKRRFGSKVFYGDQVQLQHVASKKFVKVCSESSKTESNNLLASLNDENAEGCIFKLLPRYKVRSEGDEIRFGDQLKIESTKAQGQFLHCSGRSLGQSKFIVSTDCFELNVSATESALTLYLHHSPTTKDDPENALRAGTCVRFFHKEDECYIVAEGSFAEERSVVEDVHCRLRHVDTRKHSAPSTSSNTYWQIEKQEDSRSGDIISWGERCRIKHLPTRQYLAVVKQDEEWKVTLKEWLGDDDLDTLFSFHPLIEEGEEVLLESYAHIRHLFSRQWLHLDKKNHYIRQNFNPNAKGLAGLQWDSAELYMLTTSNDKGDYDSFTLQEVTEDLVDIFNHVAGIVPVLAAFNEKVHSNSEIKQKEAIRVRDTLIELRRWMITDDERNTKNNQKLLRNLRVLEQMAEILKLGNSEVTKSRHYIIEICRECYNVIKKFLEGDSRKNENYLARFIEFFQTQMRKGLNAEEVVVEIVQDNLTIVSTMADTQMSHMIDEFVTTEDPRFLHFLSSLCVCAGRAIPSTQDRLLNELVVAHGEKLFLTTKIKKNADNEDCVFVHDPATDRVVSIRKIKEPSKRHMTVARKSTSKKEKNFFDLLEAQLHLFSRLCKGNNKAAIDTLVYVDPDNTDGYISLDEALLCVQDPVVDATIRLRYIELILVMFVDVGENRSFLDHLCYSFVYDDLSFTPYADTGDDETEALTGVVNLSFPRLKEWILDTLTNNSVLSCTTEKGDENHVLEQVLEVLSYLVRYGYYDDIGDVNEVMIPLIRLLDGKTDQPSGAIMTSEIDYEEFITTGRKEDIPENKAVFDVKCKALEVMQLFFRFKFYVKLQKFMYDFIVLAGNERKRVGKIERNPTDPPHELNSLVEADPKHPPDFLFSNRMINIVRHRIQFLCDGNVKGSGFAPMDDSIPSLESVLLDLSEYEYDKLVASSLNLLTDIYFFEEELFDKAHQGQLLTSPESLKDFREVKEDILPKLRQLLRVDANRKQQDKIVELLSMLNNLCFLPFGDQPNKQNQIMLDNFGLVAELVSFVLTKGNQGSEVGATDSSVTVGERVFQECFRLLRQIANDFLSVQTRIFNRIDDLLDVKVPTPALADLADLFTEVFTGGPQIILKVNESHIERIFDIIIHCDNVTVQAHFMVTLQAMAKIEEADLPVGHTQAFIVKYFCRYRDVFSEVLGETSDIEQKRMEILQTEEETPQIELLLGVVDLLAACAEGKNLFIESVCQNILSIEELIKIMSSNLSPARKRPFVRFLIWVYMITEEDQQNNQGTTLTHGDTMWTYLKHLADLLNGVADVLGGASSGAIENLRIELTANNRRRNSFASPGHSSGTKKFSRLVSSRDIPGATDENGELKEGLMEYLAEGVIPFLHIFYKSFFDPDNLSKDAEREKEFEISSNIARSLMHLGPELAKVFSSDKHIQMYQETLNNLLSYDDIKEASNIDKTQTQAVEQALKSAASFKRASVKSKMSRQKTLERSTTIESEPSDANTEEKIMENYKKQERLNELFNNYSRNYHYCYMGPNTASHQINSPVNDIEYSDEGEELPLGPSFQYLVELYIDPLASQELKVKMAAERLLQQLEISNSITEKLGEDEQVHQDILDIRCLKVLRALIHNQIKLIDPELKDRNPFDFRRMSDQLVVPVQNRIQSFKNAIRRVIPFLSHPNETISREALALMKALLFSGNENVQEGLVESVKQTREETLFLNLKHRLEIASSNYKETNDLRSQLMERQKEKSAPQKSSDTDEEGITLSTTKLRGSSVLANKAATLNEAEPAVKYDGKEVAISLEVINKIGDSDDLPLIQPRQPVTTLTRPKSVSFIDGKPEPKNQEIEDEAALLSQLLASDNSWTNLVLEVIGLMCDGQHRELQNYLREQPDNFKTVNVVAEVTTFLHTHTSDLATIDSLTQVHQILQALIEMSVGNVKNQQVIFDKLVVDPLNKILQLPLNNMHKECRFDETTTEKCPACAYILHLIEVKGSAVELLDVMLEETSLETKAIVKGIGTSLDVDSVLTTMSLFYELQSHPLVKRKQMDDDCERGVSKAYHALLSLIDYDVISIKTKKDLKKKADELNAKESFNASSHNSRTIEIHYEEEGSKPILAKVNFPYNPQNSLREEITELVRWNINRDSMEDKQRALLDLMPALKRDVLHQTKLKNTKILQPFLAFHTWRVRLLLFVTILLNLFVLFLYRVPSNLILSTNAANNDNETDYYMVFIPVTAFWFENIVLYVIGAIHLVLSLWIVVEYFLINFPHFRLPQFFHTIRVTLVQYLCKNKGFNTTIPQITCLDVNIFGLATLYMIILVICSVLSLVFDGYFYCLCLLFIIVDNDILKRVLRAVTKNGISLIWVAILGFIVLFIYAVISFAFLHNEFVQSSSLYCDTLGECMYSVLRFGLMDNLGLAIPFTTSAFDPRSFTARLIFDLSFFVIVTTIGLNIVFGIIVDSFSELREERSNIEADQKSKCFICDLPSYDFERRAKGFINHVKHDHNMWDYVYYSLYIDSIDTGDHNAIQKYVHELISDNDTGFFPQEEACCLAGEEDTTGEKLEELQGKVENILKIFKDKDHIKTIKAKKEAQKKWEDAIHKSSQFLSPQMSLGPQASVERSSSDRAY